MEDTIAAISTACGEGGIGIVRMSGSDAGDIIKKIFSNNRKLENRKMTYGKIVDNTNGKVIDQALVVFMESPKTYTAEDVVEINCHGSVVSLRKTLALCLANGARLADPGEFTKRAFLNGRLDLTQAEGVIDLIKARTDITYSVALDQMEGRLFNQIENIRKQLLDILVNITVNIDYPDEDIEEIVYKQLEKDLEKSCEGITELLNTAHTGKIIKEGLAVAIIGKPNVGKSSLMNALLKETRAIVTEFAGTTRDTIEETLSIKGIPVKLTDTAGIREAEDEIEKIGIEKSKESFNKADLIIFMLDVSEDLDKEDLEIMEYLEGKPVIVLANKQDLTVKIKEEEILERLPKAQVIQTSMKNFSGIKKIEDEIEKMVYMGKTSQKESLMVTNARQEDLLKKAKQAIEDGIGMTKMEEALEFIEVDIKRGYELMGEITGESVTENIVDEVFSRFCLGK